ncbi:unnamed protein product [Linum trigynum]|uniref:Aminotransferase-like plant mobile domain-containing protein n=1 Tax=Linum trigynum TaxID=586398 RepID=A0AAV2D7L7_9ROSI
MSTRNKEPNDRDETESESDSEHEPEPQPHQLVTPMSLRADRFPQFDFQLSSMAGSGPCSSHNFGARDHHSSLFGPSYEIDDKSEKYESDVVEYRIPRVSSIRDRGAASGSSHVVTGIYRDHAGRSYRAPQLGEGQSGNADVGEAWELRGPCTGGPSDPSLLCTFLGHVSHRLYTGHADRGVITCYDRSSMLRHVLDGYEMANDNARTTIETSGLAHLVDITFQSELDTTLISAFVERWQPDTNTFYMPFGEMTILLHDVAHILGLVVEGEVMVADSRQLEKWSLEADMQALLGLDRDDLDHGAQVREVARESKWYRGYGLLEVAALTHLQ